jgi:hypothetical protein
MEQEITDEQVVDAFTGTKFGDRDHRKLLEQGVLKRLCDYRTGHTLQMIMLYLGLTTQKNNVTKKGKRFAFDAMRDNCNSG